MHFSSLDEIPADPLLRLTQNFLEDRRSEKIDLGVGLYREANGETPVMRAVAVAQRNVDDQEKTKAYIPQAGVAGFSDAITRLVWGDVGCSLVPRLRIVQTPGGCGALRIALELAGRAGTKRVMVGTPTWPNHEPLVRAAGLDPVAIPHYDAKTGAVAFEPFMAAISRLDPGDLLLLHASCHNPTGADFNHTQIDAILETLLARGAVPLIDLAYQGFGVDLECDAYMARAAMEKLPETLVAYSCSKNFGLYRERTGAILCCAETPVCADAMFSNLLQIARGIYSMSPAHGGLIVVEIMKSEALQREWRLELEHMRQTIMTKRMLLARCALDHGLDPKYSNIERQKGMFSLLPIDDAFIPILRRGYGIYLADGGRINLCGVNTENVDRLCAAIRSVTLG